MLPVSSVRVTCIQCSCYLCPVFVLPVFSVPVTCGQCSCYLCSVFLLPVPSVPVTCVQCSFYLCPVFLLPMTCVHVTYYQFTLLVHLSPYLCTVFTLTISDDVRELLKNGYSSSIGELCVAAHTPSIHVRTYVHIRMCTLCIVRSYQTDSLTSILMFKP